MNMKTICIVTAVLALLAGCNKTTQSKQTKTEPEKLYIYADGTMEFQNKPIGEDEVVIYPDGYGGEKAAVKLSLEPLHPAFYRDTIVVVREPNKEEQEQVSVQ